MNLKFWQKDNRGITIERKAVLDDWPWSIPPPEWALLGGLGLDAEKASGIPAVLGVFRLLTGAASMVPMKVYRQDSTGLKSEARDTAQWQLLHRRPEMTRRTPPGTFRADCVAQILGYGKCFIRKIKRTGADGVLELKVLPSDKVDVSEVNGRLIFKDKTVNPAVERTEDEIIYVRAFSWDGHEGVSPITATREAIVAGLDRLRFERRFIQNDARPPALMSFPQTVSAEQAQAWIDAWEEQHKGPANAGRIAVIGGGAELHTVPLSNLDALFVESTRLTIEQIAAMYQVPMAFVENTRHAPTGDDWRFLTTFALGPLLNALDEALTADTDLFPDESLFAESLPDALLKQDPLAKANTYRLQRQGGWITANEIRAKENMEPRDGGDELQVTPVGGAPNSGGGGSPGNPDNVGGGDSGKASEIAERLIRRGLDVDPIELASALEVALAEVPFGQTGRKEHDEADRRADDREVARAVRQAADPDAPAQEVEPLTAQRQWKRPAGRR